MHPNLARLGEVKTITICWTGINYDLRMLTEAGEEITFEDGLAHSGGASIWFNNAQSAIGFVQGLSQMIGMPFIAIPGRTDRCCALRPSTALKECKEITGRDVLHFRHPDEQVALLEAVS